MTLLARRIYYSLAFVVFLMAGTLIILPASGYQWAGWRLGWRATGVLVVTTSPKATVTLNGQVFSPTMKFTKRMLPGQYHLVLSRAKTKSWETLVRIDPRRANVIGPVLLFPETLPIVERSHQASQSLASADQRQIIAVEPVNNTWSVQQIWPKLSTWKVSVSRQPSAVWFSPKQRLMVLTGHPTTTIVPVENPTATWTVPAFDRVFWGDQGDAVFYGQRGDQVILFDSLAKTETPIGAYSSAGWLDHALWLTTPGEQTTTIRRQAIDASTPTSVMDIAGSWQWQSGLSDALLLQNQLDRQTLRYDRAVSVGRAEPFSFGSVDHLWQPEASQPPLWSDGARLLTLDLKQHLLLLERGPEKYQAAFWLVPRHILVSSDGTRLVIRSVSDRQGRGVILEQSFDSPIELIGVDRGRKTITIRQPQSAQPVITLGWSV